MKTKQKNKATCIWCSKESEPYPIHVECFEILEVYNTLLRIYQQEYPRGWMTFLNLRTRKAAESEKNPAIKEYLNNMEKILGEGALDILNSDLFKEIMPERQRTKK